MPTERAIVDAYTRRALLLLRVGGGQRARVTRELRALARDLRAVLAGIELAALGRRELSALLREVEALVQARYAAIAEQQAVDAATIMATDAAWAVRASGLRRGGSSTLETAAAALLVQGLPLRRQWERQGTNLTDRLVAAIRTAHTTQSDPLVPIIGQGRVGRERGGVMETARQQAGTLADTSAHAAAYEGRRATWKAGGVRYLKWHAILDTRTTIRCATRAGLVYDVDFQPVGHDVPMGEPPPAHWNCRSILVGMSPDYEPPGDGQDPYSESLDDWLRRHSEQAQDELLGVRRAAAWRAGRITTRDLLGRNGQPLTLEEMRNR